ncbi:hypothetical protein [Humitalea rosea]|uniref:hypothetical protein n=1 Tax=Humitalea rosea TaxID=990373 RepID=UPI000DAD7D9D|nr:hypothetical protein [Humitalea rosea]
MDGLNRSSHAPRDGTTCCERPLWHLSLCHPHRQGRLRQILRPRPLTVTSISDVAPGARLGRSQDTSAANSRLRQQRRAVQYGRRSLRQGRLRLRHRLERFKRLAAGASAEEKADLFWRGAARFYRLSGIG